MRLSPDEITSLLTSLFPSGMIDDLAREREVVVRKRKLDVRILVWTVIVGFAVGGEARSIAGYRRTYNGATGQNLFVSSFYDRFTEQLEQLLRDLLDHAVEEVVVPHTVAPAFEQFRDVVVADATVVRLHQFLSAFPATQPDVSGLKSLDLNRSEHVAIRGLDDGLAMNDDLTVVAERTGGSTVEFPVTAQVGTPAAVRYVENGRILHLVLRRLLTET